MQVQEITLFDRPRTTTRQVAVVQSGDPDGLRPYQREAVTAIHGKLMEHRSTLLVMATGLGKTQTFGAIAAHWPGRVLVLAHRFELLDQAVNRLRQMARGRRRVGLEQAESWASDQEIIVGSVQTVGNARGEARIKRFNANPFSLVIVDEAHHATATTYRRVLDAFPSARVLGVTATPDRGDGTALGEIFESVAYQRDIEAGIGDGYLVPVSVRQVILEHVDLSAVKTTAGDLNIGQLDAEMVKANEAVAKKCLELCGDRKTIVFTTKVATAHDLVAHFNKEREGCAVAVDGEMDWQKRAAALRDHRNGRYQFLINVGIATEGYDCPEVSCVAIARPTKSRALYTQMAGRGLRVLPGTVEGIEALQARTIAIAASNKPDCLLLDFAGNAGRHALVSPLDILGGHASEDVIERAQRKLRERQMRAEDAIAEAQREVDGEREARAAAIAAIRSQVHARVEDVDPFGHGPFRANDQIHPGMLVSPPSDKQLAALSRFGFKDSELPKTRAEAGRLMSRCIARRGADLATHRQEVTLAKYGINAAQMYRETASRLLDAIATNGWRRIPAARVSEIVATGKGQAA